MAEPHPKLSESHVVGVFRSLADEHAARRHSAEASRNWEKIKHRLDPRPIPRSATKMHAFFATVAAAALLVVVAVVVTHFGSWQGSAALDYELLGGEKKNDVIRAHREPAVLLFSDGSRVQAESGASIGVDLLAGHDVSVRLSEGKLRVNVQHANNTDWRFLAGPYEVRVVGTVFDVDWSSSSERLTIVMYEGRVQVVVPGPAIKTVHAGQTLVLPEIQKTARAVEQAEPQSESTKAEPLQVVRSGAPSRSPKAAKPRSWAALVASGEFDQVVQAAEYHGLDQSLRRKDATELRALAQAAHYTGRVALSLQTWTTIRSRFAATPTGLQAAFFIGRIHDQQRRSREALQWLDTYLTESRSGTFAQEALGRKLHLVRRLKGPSVGRQVALEYLQRFPNGAHAEIARDMLAEQ